MEEVEGHVKTFFINALNIGACKGLMVYVTPKSAIAFTSGLVLVAANQKCAVARLKVLYSPQDKQYLGLIARAERDLFSPLPTDPQPQKSGGSMKKKKKKVKNKDNKKGDDKGACDVTDDEAADCQRVPSAQSDNAESYTQGQDVAHQLIRDHKHVDVACAFSAVASTKSAAAGIVTDKRNNMPSGCPNCDGLEIKEFVGLSEELFMALELSDPPTYNKKGADINIAFSDGGNAKVHISRYSGREIIPSSIILDINHVDSALDDEPKIPGLTINFLWKVFDALQQPVNKAIAASSLYNRYISVGSQVDFNIKVWKVTFEVTAIICNEKQTTMSRLCSICQKPSKMIVQLPMNAAVSFRHPLKVQSLETSTVIPVTAESTASSTNQLGWSMRIILLISLLLTLDLLRVGGAKSIIEQLQQAFIVPLMFPQLFDLYGINPPRGILLYGPPGTGKTHLARCLADQIQHRWTHLWTELRPKMPQTLFESAGADSQNPPPVPDVERMSGGDLAAGINGEQIINDMFLRCRQRLETSRIGTLVLIDEIDIICPSREQTGEAEKRMVSAILTNLDGLNSAGRGVVLLATTNRPNALDAAVRRAGRFDREIEVDVPTGQEREDILNNMLQNMPHRLSSEDVSSLAWSCQAFVAADLKLLCTSAAQNALAQIMNIGSGRVEAGNQKTEEVAVVKLEHFIEALKGIRPSGMKEIAIEVPHVKWTDIGGYDAVKQALQESVEWPIKYREVFARLKLSPPRGLLLYGPPGCSKTLMAKAVATESQMNFISVKGPELFSKWVGESEKAVREVFRKARQNSPCVVFFDEIDALGCDRQNNNSTTGVESRVLSQMLNEMDGIGVFKQVIVIGATNRPDLLDAALLRPGRMDRLLYVPLPDADSRREILRVHLKVPKNLEPARSTNFDEGTYLSPSGIKTVVLADGDLISLEVVSQLTEMTEGYSGAELAMLCREAAMMSLREQIESQIPGEIIQGGVCWRHLRTCVNKIRPRISRSLVRYYERYHKTVSQK